jgi:hypothetical protein
MRRRAVYYPHCARRGHGAYAAVPGAALSRPAGSGISDAGQAVTEELLAFRPTTAYEADHPNVAIPYLGPFWQAIIREEAGQTIITRHHLKGLLDKLEALDQE